MSYLEEFKVRINNREFPKFFQLWEEYCTNDIVDVEELLQLLEMIKRSDMAKAFGEIVETTIPLLDSVEDKESRYNILKLLIDLQTTNTPLLAELSLTYLKDRYENDAIFNERIRLTGLRGKENFQGAITNHELLAHMQVGHFVYHTGGLGTGEIMAISPLLEQATIEFENARGPKSITFTNAFKTLVPLSKDSFLARRFADADNLETEGKENPLAIIKLLLHDLGPKNAAEIKDELCELVIPEKDWTKWWQGARTKLKKDPHIEVPENLRDQFRLRKTGISEQERLDKAISKQKTPDDIILTTYNFMRDLSHANKHENVTASLQEKVIDLLNDKNLTKDQQLQCLILLETMFNKTLESQSSENIIKAIPASDVSSIINTIPILALKKRALILIRQRSDWTDLFLKLLFNVQQSALRDYILNELNQDDAAPLLINELNKLKVTPSKHPEFTVWFFQKVLSKDEKVPFNDKQGQCEFFEALLILLSNIENKPEYRDLSKKIYTILSGKRYEVVRRVLEGTSLEFIKEFLLLASKCQSLSDHDLKILRSLAEVVQPSLTHKTHHKALKHVDGHTIWTTEAGYLKTQERIKQIGTKEMIENAREVEAARALGDLRENSEYKFACERRARLQGEMKTLSDLLNRARIITPNDIYPNEVSIGGVVTIKDAANNLTTYTILGPWDVDVDNNILSFQSKLAQAMIGCKINEHFQFKDEEYTVENIRSFMDK